MIPLIPTKPCTPRSSKGEPPTILRFPSEYMIAKMMDEHLVEKLDQSKIKGMENIDPKLLNQSFDPGNQYSVPYFWGTLGIVYNTKMVKNAPEHWSDLWREGVQK